MIVPEIFAKARSQMLHTTIGLRQGPFFWPIAGSHQVRHTERANRKSCRTSPLHRRYLAVSRRIRQYQPPPHNTFTGNHHPAATSMLSPQIFRGGTAAVRNYFSISRRTI